MKKKYKLSEQNPGHNVVNEPAMEYKTKKAAAPFLSIPSIEEVKAELTKSDEDLANGIYTTHEEMKKRHL